MRATMLRDATRPTPASGLARAARTKGLTLLAHPYSPEECVEKLSEK
jgi:hypothetical protein